MRIERRLGTTSATRPGSMLPALTSEGFMFARFHAGPVPRPQVTAPNDSPSIYATHSWRASCVPYPPPNGRAPTASSYCFFPRERRLLVNAFFAFVRHCSRRPCVLAHRCVRSHSADTQHSAISPTHPLSLYARVMESRDASCRYALTHLFQHRRMRRLGYGRVVHADTHIQARRNDTP